MSYDRDELLRRIALDELCDELLGPRKGRGRCAFWRCPSPTHGPQTGRTPPLTVFTSRVGEQRWRCHACRAGGTALDLLMISQQMDFKDAIESLAQRAGLRPTAQASTPPIRRVAVQSAVPLSVAPPNAAVEGFVAESETTLWSGRGRSIRCWLAKRGFSEAVLRTNRVGADLGPLECPRVSGLPRGGPAAVFPVLELGRAVYFQVRYLEPRNSRYANPAATLAGSSPRIAAVRPAEKPRSGMVVVTEGMTDALSAAEAGYDAVALLGTGVVDERVATAISRRWRTERLVVAFDADHAGRTATVGLLDFFVRKGAGHRAAFISVPNSVGDLNAWLQADGPAFSARLSATLEAARPVGQNLRGSWGESLAAESSQVRDSFGRISGPSLGL